MKPEDAAISPVILIVDDERAQRDLLARCLREWGYRPLAAASGRQALELLAGTSADLVISDVRMPDGSGFDLLRSLRETAPRLPLLLVTAYPDLRQAVDAVKEGAVDYLTKPIDLNELQDLVAAALGRTAADAVSHLPELPPGIVAESPQFHQVLNDVYLVAPSDATVLVTGESGTGKEIIGNLVHAWSSRAGGPLVKLNCAALPDQLLESELFGHEKGAFTGALTARDGRWKSADGGTLMLDEIGELAQPLQAKLLRALEDGSYSPLGSDRTFHADVRVVAATNRDLATAMAAGHFREDLYYRLNVVELHLPALRDRPDDIPVLARRFADEFNGEATRISPATERLLLAYPWPGNVRELRNVLQSACLRARGAVILPEHLSPRVLRGAATALPQTPATTPADTNLAELEKRQIRETLAACNGNRTRAAERLGIGRRTLLYKLKAYGDIAGG